MAGVVPKTQEEFRAHMKAVVDKLFAGLKVSRHAGGGVKTQRKAEVVNLTPEFENNPELVAPPNYRSRVPTPMWLSRVREKLWDGQYDSKPEAMLADLELIGTNCLTYNAGDQEWEWRATKWIEGVRRHYRRFLCGDKGGAGRRSRLLAGATSHAAAAGSDGASYAINDDDDDGNESQLDGDGDSAMESAIDGAGPGGRSSGVWANNSAAASLSSAPVKPSSPSSVAAQLSPEMLEDSFAAPPGALELASLGPAAPEFIDPPPGASTKGGLCRFKSLLGDYDIVRDRDMLKLCNSFFDSVVRSDLCVGAGGVPAQFFSALGDERYAPVVRNRDFLSLSTFQEGAAESSEDDAVGGDEAASSRLLPTPALIRKRLRASRTAIAFEASAADKQAGGDAATGANIRPYRTIGAFFSDLFGFFDAAVRLHSKECWASAGVGGLHDEAVEQRCALARLAVDFVRALSNHFFAPFSSDEAERQDALRSETSAVVEPARVTATSRPALISALQTILGQNAARGRELRPLAHHFSRPVHILYPLLPAAYFKAIPKPMDFGSILARLTADQAADDSAADGLAPALSGTYETHAAVAADVELALSNAISYNSSSPSGVKAIETAARTLLAEWREAIWPECCLRVTVALRREKIDAFSREQSRSRAEIKIREARALLELESSKRVVSEADVLVACTVDAVRRGVIGDVPEAVRTGTAGGSGIGAGGYGVGGFAGGAGGTSGISLEVSPGLAAVAISRELRASSVAAAPRAAAHASPAHEGSLLALLRSSVPAPAQPHPVARKRQNIAAILGEEKMARLEDIVAALAVPGARASHLIRTLESEL